MSSVVEYKKSKTGTKKKRATQVDTLHNLNQQNLQKLASKVLDKQRLIIVSNRGPFTYEYADENQAADQAKLISKRGSGGVVTALMGLTNYTPVTWVAAALSEADRQIAHCQDEQKPCPGFETEPNLHLRFVSIDEDSFNTYLNVISNPLLWFVQHEMDDLLEETLSKRKIGEAWRAGYVQSNREFAKAVVAEADNDETAPFVIFHDYQLYLAPGMVRKLRPDLNLLHFTHIPWPEPDHWHNLPVQLVRDICESLLTCDIVGFQTNSAVQAFVHTCQRFVEGVRFEQDSQGFRAVEGTVNNVKLRTQVRAYPISIDPDAVRQTYASKAAQDWRKRLIHLIGDQQQQLIVRVDRLDPNKNVIGGFEAYAHLLKTHPELMGKVLFLALLVPTRESVAEYAAYKKQTFALIRKINKRYGTPDWKPVQYIYGNDYARALAALGLADVVLVNSVADGMNLVAKEAVVVGENNGVLVLSRQTGAWEELGEAVLGVEPDDVEGTAAALFQALTMSPAERAKHAQRLVQIVEKHDLSSWLTAHLQDLGHVHAAKNLASLAVAATATP